MCFSSVKPPQVTSTAQTPIPAAPADTATTVKPADATDRTAAQLKSRRRGRGALRITRDSTNIPAVETGVNTPVA